MPIKRLRFTLVFMASLFMVSYGCSDYGSSPGNSNGGDPVDTVSFAADIRDTLIVNCGQVGCHGGGAVQGGLLLGTLTWSEVINASGTHGPVIVAGNASLSNLYTKTTTSPPFSDRMPQGGPYLSTEFQNAIRDWIDQGALDN